MKHLLVHLGLPMLVLLTLASCSSQPSQADNGSGHEWEAKALVTGMIVDSADGPVGSAIVQLVAVGHNPLTDHILSLDTTDATGAYRFVDPQPGEYSIQSVHASKRTRLRTATFAVALDTTIMEPETLKTPGALVLQVPAGAGRGVVFVRGTTKEVRVDSGAHRVVLDSLAPGPLPEILFAPGTDTTPTLSLALGQMVSSGTADTLVDFAVFTDASSIVTGIWNNADSLVLDSTNAYEGRYCYRFDYTIVNWSAQCGINFDNWLASPPSNVSAYRSLHIAYKGGVPGTALYVRVFDVADSSTMVLLGSATTTYRSVDVPLPSFTNVNFSRVREIMFLVSDTPTGNGSVFFDDIRFTRTKTLH